jgi:hypothetical protein
MVALFSDHPYWLGVFCCFFDYISQEFGDCALKALDSNKGTSKNALFPQLLRQFPTRILVYSLYTAALSAAPSCTHKISLIFKGAHKCDS